MNALVNTCSHEEFSSLCSKLSEYNWEVLAQGLNRDGYVVLDGFFNPDQCRETMGFYDNAEYFRSHIHMARHGFGKGEYRYFRYPLPDLIDQHRQAIYPYLAKIANEWSSRLGVDVEYPLKHEEFLEKCRQGGQLRPTPLLLKYSPGDYNCLHQDLYGDLVFPIQIAVLLSSPDEDFTGGEFVITEQRPRMQSKVEVVHLKKGDAVAFAVHSRPISGTRGIYRVNLRHGVSRLRTGQRYTVGIIFHDAT